MSRFKIRRHSLCSGAIIVLCATVPALTAAQPAPWPNKPVTFIVPFPAGGGPDLTARLIGEKLSARIGQPVIVDNKPGAGALLGASIVAKATPDGYTLLLTPNTLVISPHVLPPGVGSGIDVLKDLQPILAPATTPMVLVANPRFGAKDLKTALELMRKSPGVPYGSAGNGSPMHFAGEMLKKSAKVDALHVPYKGTAPLLTAALGGEVQLTYIGLGGAMPYIKSGKLVPLAVTESARSNMLPSVPTATEQGVPGVEVNAWYGLFAPASTPAAIVNRLNLEVNEVLKDPTLRNKLMAAGIEPLGGSTQQLADLVSTDYQRYASLAKELKIKVD